MAKKFRDRALILAFAALALVGGYLAHSRLPPQSPNLTQLLATNFVDMNQKSAKISDWDGKVRVINFWATWCPPCREEIPGFIRLQEKYRNEGIVFIGVALDEDSKVKRFAAETNMNYPILLADYGAMELVKDAGNVSGALPFTVLVARDGSFARSFSGIVSEPELERLLKNFL